MRVIILFAGYLTKKKITPPYSGKHKSWPAFGL